MVHCYFVGLNVERAKNMPVEYYYVDKNDEGKGLLIYQFKDKLNKDELQAMELTEEEKKLSEKVEHPIMRGQRAIIPQLQMIIRLYVQYTTDSKLMALKGGNEVLGYDNYTFRHVAVFENQLRMPPAGNLAYKKREEM